MGMSGSMAAPQRAELMERVGVIPYLNDRQEWIKRECWWTWWYRWVTLWHGGGIQHEGWEGWDEAAVCGWIWSRKGRSQGSELAISTGLNCNIIHRSLLVSDEALNNIPPLGFIIVSFSSWIIQNYLVGLCQPPTTIVSAHKAQIFSCTPSRDGRNTRASVIQHQCQSHFEDSYEQASIRVMKGWSNWLCCPQTKTANGQRWNENRIGLSS